MSAQEKMQEKELQIKLKREREESEERRKARELQSLEEYEGRENE